MCIKYIFFVVYCNLHLSFSSSLIWLNKIMREKNWKTNTSKNLVRLLLFHTLVTFARCKLLNERKIEMKWNEMKKKTEKQTSKVSTLKYQYMSVSARSHTQIRSLARARTDLCLCISLCVCTIPSLPLSLSLFLSHYLAVCECESFSMFACSASVCPRVCVNNSVKCLHFFIHFKF